MDLSNMEAGLGSKTYDWANNQIATNGALTDSAVQQYLDMANQSRDFAGNQIGRYENVFQPMEDQLGEEAKSYASEPRIRSEMGAAASGQGQAFDAARANAEKALQSQGIDPSSGRYQELEAATRAARGAAQAGAAWNARHQVEDTGRQLRKDFINTGLTYPAAAINSLNSGYAGLSGALNGRFANTRAAVDALNAAKGFYDTASGLKYPPLGNAGSKSSFGMDSGGGGGGGGRGGSSGDGSTGHTSAAMVPYNNTSLPGSTIPGGDPSYFGGIAGPKFIQGPDQPPPPPTQPPPEWGPPDENNWTWMDPNNRDTFGGLTDPLYNMQAPTDQYWGSGGLSDPTQTGNYWDGQGMTVGQAGDQSQGGFGLDNGTYNPNTFDDYNTSPTNDFTAGMGANLGAYNWSNAFAGNTGWGSTVGAGDYPQQGGDFDYNTTYSDPSSSGGDSGGWSGGDGYFAQGGAIPDPNATTGGFVSQQLSPSQGQATDDIPARLNANEFVIPKDVALWKGQEFFQKLIDQSRKARMAAPAKPDFSPPPQSPQSPATPPQSAAGGGPIMGGGFWGADPAKFQQFEDQIQRRYDPQANEFWGADPAKFQQFYDRQQENLAGAIPDNSAMDIQYRRGGPVRRR